MLPEVPPEIAARGAGISRPATQVFKADFKV